MVIPSPAILILRSGRRITAVHSGSGWR